jgi:hypothetical protein
MNVNNFDLIIFYIFRINNLFCLQSGQLGCQVLVRTQRKSVPTAKYNDFVTNRFVRNNVFEF